MYSGDHILLSATYAIIVASRFNLKFVPICAGLIALNALDLDHLIYGASDDGTANSLFLHPLHAYSGVVIFLLSALALFQAQQLKLFAAIIGGYSLHMTLDALANTVHYSIPSFLKLELIWYPLFIYLSQKFLAGKDKRPFQIFIIVASLLSHGVQGFLRLVLHLEPSTHHFLTYSIGGLLPLVAGGLLILLFKNKELSLR